MMEQSLFYFTYGTEGHPFRGGWTTVVAKDRAEACRLFRAIHPDKIDGILNCCTVYTSTEFARTSMYRHGNFGVREQEIILSHRFLGGEEANHEL